MSIIERSGRYGMEEVYDEFLQPYPTTDYQLHEVVMTKYQWVLKKYNARPSGDLTILYEDLPFFHADLQMAFKTHLKAMEMRLNQVEKTELRKAVMSTRIRYKPNEVKPKAAVRDVKIIWNFN